LYSPSPQARKQNKKHKQLDLKKMEVKKQTMVRKENIFGSWGWSHELLNSPLPLSLPTFTIPQKGRNENSNLLIYSQKP